MNTTRGITAEKSGAYDDQSRPGQQQPPKEGRSHLWESGIHSLEDPLQAQWDRFGTR